MNNLWLKLMLGGSTAAMVAVASSGGALAQGGDADIEQVVVSASRISIQGYTAPTPVTVVGAAELLGQAQVDIGDSVRQLPALGSSVAPDNGGNSGLASQGTAGLDQLNLRNLGANRTLVLFDGQRVVPSDVQGNDVDLGTIPQAIIQRVDVVTGGASAAWGSDAVAGVVNLIIDKTYTGLKVNEEIGQNSQNDHLEMKSDLTWGQDYLAGRLHLEFSGSYVMAPDSRFLSQAQFYAPQALFPAPGVNTTLTTCVPTGIQPACIHTPLVGSATYSQGGLITSGPLAGTEFIGSGTPVTFNSGTSFGGNCYNCTYNVSSTNNDSLLSVPYHSTTLFGFANYRINSDLGASVMLNYGGFAENNINSDKQGVDTILSGNPYIPASIQSQMTTLGLTSIPVGSNNLEGCNLDHPTISGYESCMSEDGENILRRQMFRGVFTLQGALGADWSWNAYAQFGEMREGQQDPGDGLNSNFNNAINAVYVTAANRGTSGLAIGQITCASTLTNPTNGCQPLDVFGTNAVPQSVINYLDPGRTNAAVEDSGHFIVSQSVFAASAQGTLPWQLPAGPVAVAFGAEYHHQQQRDIADSLGLGPIAGWQNGNYTQWAGGYSVEEGFGEVDAPILKDTIVQSLDFNMAGRITNYSTSGTVETWKLGLTSQVNDDIRLRTTWSTDIRAPSLFELFSPPSYAHNSAIDPKTNKTVSAYSATEGNINLQPEVATTVSGGVVLTPQFIPGLSVSLDWYSIVIKQAIFGATVTQIEAECALGVQLYCSQLLYGSPLEATDYPGALNVIVTAPLNAASQTTSGLDFQADYTTDLFDGNMDWHMVGNYTDEYTQTALGLVYDGAGQLSASAPGLNGDVKLHLNMTATYTEGPWSGTIGGRFLGQAALNNYWQTGVNVDENTIPFVAYLDFRGSYKWNDHMQLYGTISNATNTPPPHVPSAVGGSGTNTQIYDGIGRMYQAGVRVDF